MHFPEYNIWLPRLEHWRKEEINKAVIKDISSRRGEDTIMCSYQEGLADSTPATPRQHTLSLNINMPTPSYINRTREPLIYHIISSTCSNPANPLVLFNTFDEL